MRAALRNPHAVEHGVEIGAQPPVKANQYPKTRSSLML